jgi:hypothetical protein
MSLKQETIVTCNFVVIFIWNCDFKYAGNNISGISVAMSNAVMAIHLMSCTHIELGRPGYGRQLIYLALAVFDN